MKFALALIFCAASLQASESITLASGFELHADRHEISGDRVLIYTAGGVTEIPVAIMANVEPDEAIPVAPASPEPRPEPTPPPVIDKTPAGLADQAARKFALPEGFVRSVMHAESGFQPTAVSPKGALGLMQLMPETAKTLGVDAKDPQQNAEGGAHYLRELLERYQDDPDQVLLALAAYNAGPGAVEKYHGVPPYRETREYILRVLHDWHPSNSEAAQVPPGNNPAKLSY
jgi:soluble lytic murein transglycosylase-like protein